MTRTQQPDPHIAAFTATLPPGRYTTDELHAAYTRHHHGQHHHGPTPSSRYLGRHIHLLGHQPWRTNTTRGWHITPSQPPASAA